MELPYDRVKDTGVTAMAAPVLFAVRGKGASRVLPF